MFFLHHSGETFFSSNTIRFLCFQRISEALDNGQGISEALAYIRASDGTGLLHVAATAGNTDICKYLIEDLQFNVDEKDNKGYTPLLLASIKGKSQTMAYLIEKNADPAASCERNATPLHYSSVLGNVGMISLLVSKGSDVNGPSIYGTPLEMAASFYKHEAIKVLLDHGANPNLCGGIPATPLGLALQSSSLDCAELLLKAGAEVKSNCIVQDASAAKINDTSDSSMLHQKMQYQNYFSTGKDFRGENGFQPKKPPQGYICYRCNVPGHFIQNCPTNGDPSYDIKRERQTTDTIQQSMATSNGLDASQRVFCVSEPNKEFPPELHCPLCKEVMKDAMMTTRCCFKSFCDACIRNYILSKSSCVCRATNILVDDLVPNQTIRNTISHMWESNGSGAQIAGSVVVHESIHSDCLNETIRTVSDCLRS